MTNPKDMMKEYDPVNDHEFIKLCEIETLEDTAEARSAVLHAHTGYVVDALESLGFKEVLDALHEGPDVPGFPQFTAKCKGRRCCICLPQEATQVMRLRALSEEQCSTCAMLLPKHDVYYAALVVAGNVLYLLAPYPVRQKGEWLTEHNGSVQFLPTALSEIRNRYYPLLGEASGVKLFAVFMPQVLRHGEKVEFVIDGLNDGEKLKAEDRYALRCGSLPGLTLLICRADDGSFRAHRPFFYCEHEHASELELVRVADDVPEDGVVELMTRNGRAIYAESLEAAALPGMLPTARRYMWSLSVAARNVQIVEKEMVIMEGAFFEEAKQDYLKEHGTEPPADFALHISAAHLRVCLQDTDDSDVSLCGQVVELYEEYIHDRRFTVAVVRFLPDDDETTACVLLSDEVLDKRRLAVGDVIDCRGEFYASPSSLVTDAASWQDSEQILETSERERRMAAMHDAYEQLAAGSMGLAVAVSSFLAAGWEVAESLPTDFLACRLPVSFCNPEGKMIKAYVDTVINGAESTLSCADLAAADGAVYCRVSLDYHPESGHYAVSMATEPELPGVYSRLVSARSPIPHAGLSDDDDSSDDEWEMPEHLDESMAAALMADALEIDEWLPLAEWLCEEAVLESEFSRVSLTGKVDILRHLASRVQGLGEERCICHIGTIRSGRSRRAALSIRFGIDTQLIATFDDTRGKIGRIRISIASSKHNFRRSD